MSNLKENYTNIYYTAEKTLRVFAARRISIEPTSLRSCADVTAFLCTREYEMNALSSSIIRSKNATMQRAFQSVPRGMRRRTASHDPNRIPKRLRLRTLAGVSKPSVIGRIYKKITRDWLRASTARKLQEVKGGHNVVAQLLSKRWAGTNLLRTPPRPHSKFRKRQRDKTWLPTHVWHAKRARMVMKWGVALPESCNEKAFRPTIRASRMRGAIAWDTSYFSSLLLKGSEEALRDVIGNIFTSAALEKKIREGKRYFACWAYEKDGYPERPIAPVTLLWCPVEEGLFSMNRKVLVRVHPSAYLELWNSLLCFSDGGSVGAVTLEDLRFELGSIDIAGPSATDALIGALIPVNTNTSAASLWISLSGLTNPAVLPPGAILGFDIMDPRLNLSTQSMCTISSSDEETRIYAAATTWPLIAAPFALLDSHHRTTAVQLQQSQKRLAKRRALVLPGTSQVPTKEADPCIPIILLSTSKPGGWTLLLPWKWVLPVWYKLMNSPCEVRFGGLQEARQVAFEYALPSFPADFPGTLAGARNRSPSIVKMPPLFLEPKKKALFGARGTVAIGHGS